MNRSIRILFCSLLAGISLLFVSPSGVWAGDGHDHGAHDAAHGDAHGDEGHGEKPALLQWDFGTAFWSILVFVILLTILRVAAWKPIMQGLQSREEFIRTSISDAKKERQAAEKLLADYTAQVEKAREEATAIVDEGRRDADEVRKRIAAESKAESEKMLDRAKKEIGLARDDAVKQLHDQTILLATQVAGKLVKKQMTAEDQQGLIDESLAELSHLN